MKISNYNELRAAINELSANKVKQEELIKQNVGDIKDSLNPFNILKSALKRIVEDKELHRDALKASLNMGSQYIIEKIFKSNKNAKRHFAANIFEKLITSFTK